jgi:hypothetical protein
MVLLLVKNTNLTLRIDISCIKRRKIIPNIQTHTPVYTCIILILISCKVCIVTCRVVRVKKMTGSNSDDWIY